jgi:flagellar hook-associated protein 3 FlgL
MRIATNTISDNIINQIDSLSTQQATLQGEVSTGQRITQPEDDPSGVNTALSLESQIRAVTQYNTNATRA